MIMSDKPIWDCSVNGGISLVDNQTSDTVYVCFTMIFYPVKEEIGAAHY